MLINGQKAPRFGGKYQFRDSKAQQSIFIVKFLKQTKKKKRIPLKTIQKKETYAQENNKNDSLICIRNEGGQKTMR